MKYYIYISSLKVDMLFDQIPIDLKRKVATELKIDLKFLSTTFKQDATQETRISKLQLVLKAIRAEGLIGDVTAPKEYFDGELNMAWGPPQFFHERDDPQKEQMVIFGSSPDGTKLVGLIGSKSHMLGETGNPVHAEYARPGFMRKVADWLQEPLPDEIASNLEGIHYSLAHLTRAWEGSTERVEFVAKTFLRDKDILLGSPLYVAQAQQPVLKTPLKANKKRAWWQLWKR